MENYESALKMAKIVSQTLRSPAYILWSQKKGFVISGSRYSKSPIDTALIEEVRETSEPPFRVDLVEEV